MKAGGLIAAIVFSLLAITGVSMYVTEQNRYTSLETTYGAQVQTDKVVYDEVWKTIKQQANVSEQYSEDFRKNYTSIMSSRNYGGELMKWITEANPNFTPDLYVKLMNTIEIKRSEFTQNQKKLISVHREMAAMKGMFPSSLFLWNRNLPDISEHLVTSTQTEAVFATHKDDSLKLFTH